jgi:TolB protein
MKKSTFLSIPVLFLAALLAAAPALTAAQDGLSPDLRIAYVSNAPGNEDIYLMSQGGESDLLANLTNNPARDWNPAWSPDGGRILFNSDRDGRDSLYIMDADGSNPRPLFAGKTFNDYEGAWSPDGTQIVFVSERSGIGRDLYIASADGANVRPLTDTHFMKGHPVWSPDGLSIVYWEQEATGDIQLYSRNLTNDTLQRLTTAGPANGAPVWSPDGSTIYFDSDREGSWYVFRIEPNGNFPERVSEAGYNSGRASVSPDGRILAYVTDKDESDEIYLVNTDGTGRRRLTNNHYSDHSPAWQPAVPPNQLPEQGMVTPEPTAPAEAGVDLGIALNQSGSEVAGVPISPLPLPQLLINYGIAGWRNSGWTGAGQKVGVIDTDFGRLQKFIEGTGPVELPPDDLLTEYSNSNNDHGTDVLEVIRAIAPNANLFACRYEGHLDQLKACRDWMMSRDVRIINHSVGLPILPLNGQHPWATLVADTYANDIFWVNSAGNFNRGYLRDDFQDANNDGLHEFIFGNVERDLIADIGQGPYSGSVLLSWEEAPLSPDTFFGEGQLLPRLNFDLEIVDAATGEILNPTAGHEAQDQDITAPPYEVVRLSDITRPFAIRVRNAGLPLDQRIEFAIFVEFARLEFTESAGKVIAPADARDSFTVGAINGNRDLAAYSSFGQVVFGNVTYPKPDISAPGEIILSDNSFFIGTSAAAPVIAGIAALMLEENPTLRAEDIADTLRESWALPQNSDAFGAGIVQLGLPPSFRTELGVVIAPPAKTVFPQPEDTFVDQGYLCVGAVPSRFELDVQGYVNFDLGLTIRQTPSTQGARLDTLQMGQRFRTIGGPVCASGLTWWEVELDTGATGWLGEGNDYYLIAPINMVRAQLPDSGQTVCPNALAPQLKIGERGRLLQGGLFFFRAQGARYQMDPLSAGTVVQVLGGPACEGRNDNVLRWYVRVVEGSRAGYEGWVAEGDTDTRLIEPINEPE